MKLTNIGKTTFNINGVTIHFTLVIPLNKFFNEVKALNDEKGDNLIKMYESITFISHR
jgi:hypothetical protein